jgi:hypothetical protein
MTGAAVQRNAVLKRGAIKQARVLSLQPLLHACILIAVAAAVCAACPLATPCQRGGHSWHAASGLFTIRV